MAINWNGAEFVSPKIGIAPEVLPLEAAQKVGDTLQGRYDTAKLQETKLDSLTKKLMMSSDKKDQELAAQIVETYKNRIKERSASGNYQDMLWQTTADAEDFANIYTGLSERAKKMQQYRDIILTNEKQTNLDKRKWNADVWEESQSKAKFDPENRFLTDVGVTAPLISNTFDFTKALDTWGKGFEADLSAVTGNQYVKYNARDKMGNGQLAPVGGIYDKTTSHKVSFVKESDIEKVLDTYIKNSPEAVADLQSEKEYLMSKGMTEEGAMAKIQNERIEPLKNAVAIKNGFTRTEHATENKFDGATTQQLGLSNANNMELYDPAVVNTEYTRPKQELSSEHYKALQGDPMAKYNSRVVIQQAISNLRNDGKEGEAIKLEKGYNAMVFIQDLATKNPAVQKTLTEYNIAENVKEKFTGQRQGVGLLDAANPVGFVNDFISWGDGGKNAMQEVLDKVDKGTIKLTPVEKGQLQVAIKNWGIAGKTRGLLALNPLDKFMDDIYEANKPSDLQVKILRPTNKDERAKMEGATFFTGDFNIDPEKYKIDPDKKQEVKMTGHSAEAIPGIGLIYELNVDGKQVLAPAKHKGITQMISQQVYDPAMEMDTYASLPPVINKTKIVPFAKAGGLDLIKQVEGPDGQIVNQPVFRFSNQAEIVRKDGAYRVIDNGHVVEGPNGEKEYSTVSDLLYKNKIR
jgi:hypothetical protein